MPIKAGGPVLPEGVTARTTEVTVSAIPDDHVDHSLFAVRVVWRGGERYGVVRFGRSLAADGTWDYEPVSSERTDEWIAAHRFTEYEATELAGRACLDLVVNGFTVADILAEIESEKRCPNCPQGFDCSTGHYATVEQDGSTSRGSL